MVRSTGPVPPPSYTARRFVRNEEADEIEKVRYVLCLSNLILCLWV